MDRGNLIAVARGPKDNLIAVAWGVVIGLAIIVLARASVPEPPPQTDPSRVVCRADSPEQFRWCLRNVTGAPKVVVANFTGLVDLHSPPLGPEDSVTVVGAVPDQN